MIEEQYVSFEVAKLLKEKGFNEACNRVYEWSNLKYTTLPISPLMSLGELGGFHPKQLYVNNNELGDIVYTAPTHQMAMAWLREVHNVGIFPSTYTHITDRKTIHSYGTAIINLKTYELMTDSYLSNDTYEEAVEAALKYCLENLILMLVLINILILYYIFSILFMIGYVDTRGETIYAKLFIYFIVLIIAPIMFPINIGYYISKNS